jgi:hypothetical protein
MFTTNEQFYSPFKKSHHFGQMLTHMLGPAGFTKATHAPDRHKSNNKGFRG